MLSYDSLVHVLMSIQRQSPHHVRAELMVENPKSNLWARKAVVCVASSGASRKGSEDSRR